METRLNVPDVGGSPRQDQGGFSGKYLVLAAVMLGTFMAPLDSSVVNIALPTLTTYFRSSMAVIEWVPMAYLLTTSTLLLTFGRLGDIWTHKRMYVAGFAVFTVGSILCGLAPSIRLLIAFRVFQAVGGGMMFAASPAIITQAFPPHERGRALGISALSVAAGLTIGPPLGGFLATNYGWRWIFFINLPVGIAAIVAAAVLVPRGETKKQAFDSVGAATAFVALFTLLLALSKGGVWGWGSATTVALLATAVVSGAGFIAVEKRVTHPMLDLSLFHNRLFAAANASALISYLALFAVMFLMPFYLTRVMGLPAKSAGVVLLAVPLSMAVVSPLAGYLSDFIGSRVLSSLGLAVAAVGLGLLSRLGVESTPVDVAVRLLVAGFGLALFQTPNTSAIMGSVPRDRAGVASGMVATMRNVGMVLGIAITGAVVASREVVYRVALASTATGKSLSNLVFTLSLRDAFLLAAVICTVGVIASLVRGDGVPRTRGAPRPEEVLDNA